MVRTFDVVVSKHRPDGLVTMWVYAHPEFTMKELQAKKRRILSDLEFGKPVASKFMFAIQEGFDLLDYVGMRFYFSEDKLAEFICEVHETPTLLLRLQRLWGGCWDVQTCDWSDPFKFDKGK